MTVKIRTRPIKWFQFLQVPVVNVQTGGVQFEEYRQVRNHILIPMSDAKRFTGKSKRYIQDLIAKGIIQGFNENGTERKVRKRGGNELYFDLLQWDDFISKQ